MNVVRKWDDMAAGGKLLAITDVDDHSHRVLYEHRPDKIIATCECKAVWSHKPDETPEQLQSIFESHVKYGKRAPLKPD